MSGNGSDETAVATVQRSALLRPVAGPRDILSAQDETRALIAETLLEGRDYGVIPGVKKPSLFKPGAERVGIAFGCFPRYRIVEQEVDHDRKVEWRKKKRVYNNAHKNDKSFREVEESGESLGLYRYVVECEIVHRETGQVVGNCIGVCSTMEAKYVDRPRECENTALKMSEKRAHVGAVLNAFGLSEQFTQDVEDTQPAAEASDKKATPAADGVPAKRFGPDKGTPLSKISDTDLEKAIKWAQQTDAAKFEIAIEEMEKELDSRGAVNG